MLNSTLVTICSLVPILLLIALLVLKEIVRALDSPKKNTWMLLFNLAIIPLLLLFAAILVLRYLFV
jgi:hypothetical protein